MTLFLSASALVWAANPPRRYPYGGDGLCRFQYPAGPNCLVVAPAGQVEPFCTRPAMHGLGADRQWPRPDGASEDWQFETQERQVQAHLRSDTPIQLPAPVFRVKKMQSPN